MITLLRCLMVFKVNEKRFCGKMGSNEAPRYNQIFYSESSRMQVDFVSDYSNEEPKPFGFVAHFKKDGLEIFAYMSFWFVHVSVLTQVNF